MKLLMTALMLLALASPAAAQLNAQQQALLGNIFRSELDHRQKQQEWQALYNRIGRTAEEEYVMLDYAKNLAHNQDLIAVWIANLSLGGVNFKSAAVLNLRQIILEELRVKEQAEINYITGERARLQAEITAIQNDPTIPEEMKAELIAQKNADRDELASRLPNYENRKAILDALKAGAIIWDID
ncbi:hypothetical protein [Candidatus Magnetobacterium casense]|uniref:Secreted protein n=1 Tax=Candidatus Magnetobacterium casense TaxID=1455061 RepID=A0ABS6S0J7_9BACT|nr:hypothetical protein [Candidatus Magnetobacterium casensis]MBV6342373.1 hypothetical protein [Candidatus Magnetobacterium casensis]